MFGLFSCVVPVDPRTFSAHKKATIIFFVILAGAIPGLSSTIYFPALPEITDDLHASSIGVTATTSLFILVQGICPIMWSSLSDHFHMRKQLFLVSLIIFAFASLGACFVHDIWSLVALRCIQAIGASAAPCLGPGTIADLYPIEKRGTAMGLLFFGVFIGPLAGPNIGGGLTYAWTWRATFWFCFTYSSLVCICMIFFTVETYRPRSYDTLPTSSSSASLQTLDASAIEMVEGVDSTRSVNSVSEEGKEYTKGELSTTDKESSLDMIAKPPISAPIQKNFNPIKALLYLRFPFVLLPSLATAVAFGVMFTTETILPELFADTYNLNSWQIGLCYLGGGIGNVVGSFVGGRYLDRVLAARARERGGRALAEDRYPLFVLVCGFGVQPLGVLLFAWSVAHGLHLSIPILGFGLLCFGMTQILLSGSTYLVDATGQGASATAAANAVRNGFSCVLSLVASPMLQYVGVGYIGVLAAGLCVLASAGLVLNKTRGEHWRHKSGIMQPTS